MTGRRRLRLLSHVFPLLMLLGCSPLHSTDPASVGARATADTHSMAPVEDRSNLNGVLRRLARLAGQPKSKLAPALLDANTAFEKSGDVGSRLELAWLLSQPGTDFQDRGRAAKLLDEFLDQTEPSSDFGALAILMRAEMSQQNRRINALAEVREELAAENSEKRALEVQIDTLTGLLETLQQQFEELKEIERNVN